MHLQLRLCLIRNWQIISSKQSRLFCGKIASNPGCIGQCLHQVVFVALGNFGDAFPAARRLDMVQKICGRAFQIDRRVEEEETKAKSKLPISSGLHTTQAVFAAYTKSRL